MNDTLTTNSQYERLWLEKVWHHSDNPASLYEMNMPDWGKASLNYGVKEGNCHRPQQPAEWNNFGFQTQRFQSLDKMRFSGNFSFDQTNEKDRNFCDVLNPYRNTPYVFATKNEGDWSKQHYALSATASTYPVWDWLNAGLDVHYAVATGARENDPRPLNLMNQVRVTPGLLAHISTHHKLGVHGFYQGYKEEVSMMIKTPNESFIRYQLLGLGEFNSGTMSGSYNRAYFGDTFGGNIQYSLSTDEMKWLTQAGFSKRTERVRDQISRPKKAGKYCESTFIGESYLLLNASSRFLHQVGVKGQYLEGSGTEYKQNFDRDQEKWITFSQSVKYELAVQSVRLYYQTMKKAQGYNYDYKALISLALQNSEKKYYLPNSNQQITSLQTHAQIVKYFDNTWRVGLSLGYHTSLEGALDLSDTEEPILQEQVTIPDHDYFLAEKLEVGADISYYHQLSNDMRDKLFNQWFLQAWGKRLEWMDPAFDWNQSGRLYFGFGFGIVY